VTAPGTVLSIGATAVVPFEYTSESGKHDIQVTVTGFRAGSVSDFADFEDSDKKKLADKTPYYVDITAQALGSDLEKLEYASISYNDIGALDQDGDRMSPLTVFGGFDPCKDGNFDKAGALQTCMIYTANSAQTLTSITWQGTDGGYSDIDGQPIVWK
jgi:hypothetical protein